MDSTSAHVPQPGRFYGVEGYRVDDSVGYLMRRILASMTRRIDRRLDAHDLTNAQWAPLFMIAQGRASTVAELARECESDAGAMTRTLDRLEAKGLLQRHRSHTDRRVVNLSLTPSGGDAAAGVPAVLAETLNEHLAGFSVQEWRTLQGLLRRMLDNAERMRDGPNDAAIADAAAQGAGA